MWRTCPPGIPDLRPEAVWGPQQCRCQWGVGDATGSPKIIFQKPGEFLANCCFMVVIEEILRILQHSPKWSMNMMLLKVKRVITTNPIQACFEIRFVKPQHFRADSIFACIRFISRTRIHPAWNTKFGAEGSPVDPHPALWALKIVTLLTHHHFDWHLAGFRARNWIRLSHFQPLKKRRLIAKVLWKVGYHPKRKLQTIIFQLPC